MFSFLPLLLVVSFGEVEEENDDEKDEIIQEGKVAVDFVFFLIF